MARRKLNPFQQALKDASREMGRPTSDWLVERLATLIIQMRLVRTKGWSANSPANTSDLVALMDQITEVRKQGGGIALPKVEIGYVEGVQGYYVCQHCQKENFLDPGRYDPLPDKPAPVTPRQTEADRSPSGDAPSSPAIPLQATQKPADKPALKSDEKTPSVVAERGPVGSGHPWTLPSGVVEHPPLKRNQPADWHRAPADRAPDLSAYDRPLPLPVLP